MTKVYEWILEISRNSLRCMQAGTDGRTGQKHGQRNAKHIASGDLLCRQQPAKVCRFLKVQVQVCKLQVHYISMWTHHRQPLHCCLDVDGRRVLRHWSDHISCLQQTMLSRVLLALIKKYQYSGQVARQSDDWHSGLVARPMAMPIHWRSGICNPLT